LFNNVETTEFEWANTFRIVTKASVRKMLTEMRE